MRGNVRLIVIAAIAGLMLGFTGGYVYVNQQIQAITITSSALVEAANKERSILAERLANLEEEINIKSRELEKEASKTQDAELALSQARADTSSLQDSLTRLQGDKRMLTDEVENLEGQVQSLEKDLANVNIKLTSASSTLVSIDELVKKLESDRDLLLELRKSTPADREEAEAYWANVKTLAARVDPALAVAVEKIRGRVDAYFDWIESQPLAGATFEEFCFWVFSAEPAVFEYGQNIEKLRNDVLLNMILRIDTAGNILAR
jgi:vacuolar-type H+-ATPase subunit I/STV1